MTTAFQVLPGRSFHLQSDAFNCCGKGNPGFDGQSEALSPRITREDFYLELSSQVRDLTSISSKISIIFPRRTDARNVLINFFVELVFPLYREERKFFHTLQQTAPKVHLMTRRPLVFIGVEVTNFCPICNGKYLAIFSFSLPE